MRRSECALATKAHQDADRSRARITVRFGEPPRRDERAGGSAAADGRVGRPLCGGIGGGSSTRPRRGRPARADLALWLCGSRKPECRVVDENAGSEASRGGGFWICWFTRWGWAARPGWCDQGRERRALSWPRRHARAPVSRPCCATSWAATRHDQGGHGYTPAARKELYAAARRAMDEARQGEGTDRARFRAAIALVGLRGIIPSTRISTTKRM